MADATIDAIPGGAPAADAPAPAEGAGAPDAGAGKGPARGADGKFAGKPDGGQGADAPSFDWRKELAGGDAKFMKRLERFNSAADFMRADASAQELIAKGGHLPKPPAADAPDEVKAEWRKAIGVPDKPDGYALPKIAGFEFGEGDKQLVGSFQERLHKAGAPQSVFDEAVGWYADILSQAAEEGRAVDDQARLDFEKQLGDEWGPEYRANVALAERWMDGLPEGLGEVLRGARDAQGRPIAANPAFYRFGAAEARMNGYVPRGLAKGGADPAASIAERMAELEAQMADKRSPYNTTPKLQQEYVELADQAAKLKDRAA